MSVDSRLQNLWKPRLVEAEPPLQQVPPSITSEGHTQEGDDPNPHESLPCVGIGGPVSSIAPTEEAEARAQRTERRDERRLWIEMIALVLGFFGLVGLLLTLRESRLATQAALQSATIARKQMELSERPWVTVDVAPSRPVVFYDNGRAFMSVGVSLKNVGHSVATDMWVDTQVVLVSHGDGTPESLNEPERRRNASCEWIRELANPREGGYALFPEQRAIPVSLIPLTKEHIEARTFEEPGAVGKFIDPVVIGCVSYRDTFTSDRHVTGFVYLARSLISPNGFFRVGETVPVEKIQLTSAYLVGAYID